MPCRAAISHPIAPERVLTLLRCHGLKVGAVGEALRPLDGFPAFARKPNFMERVRGMLRTYKGSAARVL